MTQPSFIQGLSRVLNCSKAQIAFTGLTSTFLAIRYAAADLPPTQRTSLWVAFIGAVAICLREVINAWTQEDVANANNNSNNAADANTTTNTNTSPQVVRLNSEQPLRPSSGQAPRLSSGQARVQGSGISAGSGSAPNPAGARQPSARAALAPTRPTPASTRPPSLERPPVLSRVERPALSAVEAPVPSQVKAPAQGPVERPAQTSLPKRSPMLPPRTKLPLLLLSACLLGATTACQSDPALTVYREGLHAVDEPLYQSHLLLMNDAVTAGLRTDADRQVIQQAITAARNLYNQSVANDAATGTAAPSIPTPIAPALPVPTTKPTTP